MVKIAFLLLAHGNIPQLNCFIKQLLKYEGSYVYIHLDIKAGDAYKDIIEDERVKLLPERYDVKWGDYSQIVTERYLLTSAFEDGKYDWFSLHSGGDMAIRPISEFADFLSRDGKLYYANYKPLPVPGWGFGGGYGRLCLDWPDALRKRTGNHSWQRYARAILGRMYGAGLVKTRPIPEKYKFCGGSAWFTASYDCVADSVKFIKENPDFEDWFVKSLCGDEIYFDTVFDTVRNGRPAVANNHYRYIDWKDRGQEKGIGAPNTCAMDFLQDIEHSGRFFARKFDMNFDKEIVDYFLNKC